MTSHPQFGNLADAAGSTCGSPTTPIPSPTNVTTFQHNDGPKANFNNSTQVFLLAKQILVTYVNTVQMVSD